MTTKLAPLHPGEVLNEDFMAPRNLTSNHLSLHIRVPADRLSKIVCGRRSINADTALRLARYLGTTPGFWLNLQARYDVDMAQDALASQ